jgi:Ca2+-binding EF-hand superfamily protein
MNQVWIGAAVAVLATGVAGAGTPVADAEKLPEFSIIDADGDGYISNDEADAVPELKRIFASVDGDRDGQLDTSEWSKAVARMQGLG